MQIIIKTLVDGQEIKTAIDNVESIEECDGITDGLVRIHYIGSNGKLKMESALLNGYTELIVR